jgi:hypothetical protein
MSITRRKFAAGTAAIAAATVIRGRPANGFRWGELLPTTHPGAMLDRTPGIKAKSSGRIEVQSSDGFGRRDMTERWRPALTFRPTARPRSASLPR